MFETTHRVKIKGEVYEYPAFKSANHIKGKYVSFMRTFGNKRTKEQAEAQVLEWESNNLKRNKRSKNVSNKKTKRL